MIKLKNWLLLLTLFCTFSLFAQEGDKEALITAATKSKVEDFQNHLRVIGNKSLPHRLRNRNIHSAERFFKDPQKAIIEVSNKSGTKRKYNISDYLRNLRDLDYHEVIINYEQPFVKFTQIKDGYYLLEAECYQRFKSKNQNGEVVYCDLTIKIIEITALERLNEIKKNILDIKFDNIIVDKTFDDCN